MKRTSNVLTLWRTNSRSPGRRGRCGANGPEVGGRFQKWRHCRRPAVTMAESEATKETSGSFSFKKSTKKFAGRKRKASDSDKGRPLLLYLRF